MTSVTGWQSSSLKSERRTARSIHQKVSTRLNVASSVFLKANNRFDVNLLSAHNGRFGAFRQTLDAEMKTLYKKGLGTKTKRAEPITPDEEALLQAMGQLGIYSQRESSSAKSVH